MTLLRRLRLAVVLLQVLLLHLDPCGAFSLGMSSTPKRRVPKNTPPLSSPVRVVKCFPNLSRRQADKAALDGRVRVDGNVVPPSFRLTSMDQVLTLDQKPVRWQAKAREGQRPGGTAKGKRQSSMYKYYRYHKPTGVTCTMDLHDKRSLAHKLPHKLRAIKPKLFPVGRLDLDSHGLVLLTNDGKLADALLQPRFHREKEYHVVVQPPLSPKAIEKLRRGVEITTVQQRTQKVTTAKTNPCRVEYLPGTGSKRTTTPILRFVLSEGRNRQIRKCVEAVGSTVVSLQRVRQGTLDLGNQASGSVLPLQDTELQALIDSSTQQSSGLGRRNRLMP